MYCTVFFGNVCIVWTKPVTNKKKWIDFYYVFIFLWETAREFNVRKVRGECEIFLSKRTKVNDSVRFLDKVFLEFFTRYSTVNGWTVRLY